MEINGVIDLRFVLRRIKMKGLTKRYLRSVEKFVATRAVPMIYLAKAYNASIGKPEKHEVIRRSLIEKNLRSVGVLAKRVSRATRVELDELIGEGNLILCQFFSGGRTLTANFYQNVRNKLEGGLKKFALEQILDRLLQERLSPNLVHEDSEFSDEPKINFETFDEIARRILVEREYKVFRDYDPLYGKPKTQNQIGAEMGLSKGRINQIYAKARRIVHLACVKACQEIEEGLGARVDLKEPTREHLTRFFRYSEYIARNLDEELRKKQGVSLSRVAKGLNLQPHELVKFFQRATGAGMTREDKKALSQKYLEKEERPYLTAEERRRKLEDLHIQIISNLGMKPRDFMAYFNMSEEAFVHFVKERFLGLKERYIRRVITLSEQEKTRLEGPSQERGELSELEILDRVLHLLQSDKYSQYFPNVFIGITERLKHALFPVFITDQDRCLSLLERKVEEYEGDKAQQYFREAYDFFRKSKDLHVDRLRMPLDSFQSVDVLTLADKGRHILASETGVGKSLEIIATAEYLSIGKILILTSKSSTIATWSKEIKKHLGDDAVVITGDDQDKEALLEKARDSKWVVSTYETYQRLCERFKELQPEMVVIDEADVMNNPSSQRTKAILNTNVKYKYCVSGWIFRNRRSELWPILNWLYPEEYPFRDQFLRDYCKDELGRLRLKYELSHKLIYRPKSLVLPNLPPIEQHTVPVKMSRRERAEYKEAEENFIEWYKQNNLGQLPSGVAITKLHSLRRTALKPKFAKLQGILTERHQTPNKTVVFCSYVDEAMQLAASLSEQFNVGYFDGQTDAIGRQEAIDRFNRDPKQEMLVMTEAGGKSIELFPADHLYLFNPVWTYSLKKQLTDRLHRRGQQRKVHIYEFITRGTLEEGIAARTERKREEYEKTVIDPLGYNSWFEENQESVIGSIVKDIVGKR